MEAYTKWACLDASVSYSTGKVVRIAADPGFGCVVQASHSLLALQPSTGRKHQLRVHVAQTLKGEYGSRPRSKLFRG